MENGINAFFYAIRFYGVARVTLAIYESRRPLKGMALLAVLAALRKREVLETYRNDLLYLAAKGQYRKFDLMSYSDALAEIFGDPKQRLEPKDTRTAAEIVNDLLTRLERSEET